VRNHIINTIIVSCLLFVSCNTGDNPEISKNYDTSKPEVQGLKSYFAVKKVTVAGDTVNAFIYLSDTTKQKPITNYLRTKYKASNHLRLWYFDDDLALAGWSGMMNDSNREADPAFKDFNIHLVGSFSLNRSK